MAVKLPAIMLYPADWEGDEIAYCSIAAQGLWLRMMFLMHRSTRYGYLTLPNGAAIPPTVVAAKCGITVEAYTSLLVELDSVGKLSRTPEGVIFSRRMVKDELHRSKNRDRVHKHRNNALRNGTCNASETHRVTDLYAASSSSTTSTKKEQKPSRQKREPDSRHLPFREAIEGYWNHANQASGLPFVWGGPEAGQLGNLLAASPQLTLDQFKRLLWNRSKSVGVSPGDPPHQWLGTVTRYTEVLNQFNRTAEAGNGTSTTKTGRTLDALRQSLEGRPNQDHAHEAGYSPAGGGGRIDAPRLLGGSGGV